MCYGASVVLACISKQNYIVSVNTTCYNNTTNTIQPSLSKSKVRQKCIHKQTYRWIIWFVYIETKQLYVPVTHTSQSLLKSERRSYFPVRVRNGVPHGKSSMQEDKTNKMICTV